MYRGWALFGIVLFGALFANIALAWAMRGQRAFVFVLICLGCLVANLVIFFAFTFPANQGEVRQVLSHPGFMRGHPA